ncbi:PadR family transcriptional regulator [Ornithinibacillus gellani]|uniref:PadR family transcriptional regulator n=1 Tax=Ornithinibacillus gellani TaxID=2293253 RepID=UPI000F494822|nr:PadR family transcriptional regulator [Ornithinibacillus gellani]TQS76518.1 PadR family transcriptional regulator [Ornithinibacillus gellani]
MSLRYGILGMLSKWDATGYDLKKEFDEVMGIFWHSHLSQIYPELNKLEEKEWVTSKLVAQADKPDKKVYTITESGQKALFKWLMTPPDFPRQKDPFLMQLFFKDNIPVQEAIFHLQTHKKQREARLEKISGLLQSRWDDMKRRNVMKPRIILSLAVLKRGLDSEMNYIKWCEDTIQLLEATAFLWEKEERTEQAFGSDGERVEYTSNTSFQDIEPLLKAYLCNEKQSES